MTAPPFDIHIAYRRGDREVAAALARRLELRGLSVQYDAGIGAERSITPDGAAEQAGMIVLLISSEPNDGRALRQLLTAADRLSRPVVSLLIEDVRPDAAALLALADRIWIRAFPDAMARLDEIVGLLARLSGKVAPDAPAPAAPDETSLEAKEQSLDAAISDLLDDAFGAGPEAPREASAYVGKAGSGGQPARPRGGAMAGLATVVTLGIYGAVARRDALKRFRANAKRL